MRPFRNPEPDDSLAAVLRGVRRRWRLRVFLRGAVIALAIALLVMLASSAGLQKLGYDATDVSVVRWITYVALAAVLAWLILRPMLHSLPDERVALYVEEHEPSLELTLLSAVEPDRPGVADVSPALRDRLVKIARERTRQVGDGRRVERSTMFRTGGAAFAIAASAALIFALGPSWLRQGATVLFAPWRSAEAATPYAINVEPGNIQVPKGGDVEIIAHLRGFLTSDVEIAIRRGIEGAWERIPMGPSADSASLMVRLFDLDQRTDYYVEANGIRSPVFRIDVTNLPYVSRLDLEYRYPAYTGRAPETVPDGGDITALRGTRVTIASYSTVPTTAGRIILDGQDTIPLSASGDSALAGDITVKQAGSYRIELQAADGRFVPASLDYMIDVLDDGAPSVHIRTPGRDAQVTSVEEVYIEAEAEDDYRVQTLELAYSVNGGPERAIVLQKNGHRQAATAGHTLYLEEMELVPGDLVAYYARASDGAPGRKAPAKSDIYFLNIRPFSKDYRQSQQSGGGGAGGGVSPQGLSSAQREVIAGTFNVVRDRPSTSADEFRENVATLALAQGRLREQVEELLRRMNERGMGSRDTTFAQIAGALDTASTEMKNAEEHLGKREPDDAMSPEQKALQQLQHAEAMFRDVQVSMGSQGQGGGQGGAQAQDLADLFELNTDKLRNQYETVRQSAEQKADEQVDEAMERLRRLAARQQQENEQLQRAASQSPNGSSGGGNQRAIAEEAEKLARQLERLSREQKTKELEDAARRLRESAAAMRRAASNPGERGASQGADALDQLREARRLLEESHAGRLRRDIEEAQRAARELSESQKEVGAEAKRLTQGNGDEAAMKELEGRKDAQARQAEALESRLDRIARDGGREQPEAARQAQEAARGMREDRLRDRIEYSKRVVRSGDPEYTQNFEEQIGAAIERARERIDRAAGAVAEGGTQKDREALEKARDLVRSMESMSERLGDRSNSNSNGQQQSGQQQGQQQNGQQQSGQQQDGQQKGQQNGSQQQNGQQQAGQQQGGQQQGGQQQGGQQQGGQRPSGQANGGPPAGASGGMPRWAGAGRPLTPDERRQLQREYGARRADAEALRRELRASGQELEGIDEQIARLRQLEGGRGFDDPQELQRLHEQALEGLKAYEFALRRSLEGNPERPLLNASGEVPPGFKSLVEEYYKSLAKPPR